MENGWEWTGEWCERVGVGCGNGVVMEVGKGPDWGRRVGLLVGKYVDWRKYFLLYHSNLVILQTHVLCDYKIDNTD